MPIFNGIAARTMGNRLLSPNMKASLPTPNIINGVEVNISEQAQKLFAQMQQENAETLRLQAVADDDGSLTPKNAELGQLLGTFDFGADDMDNFIALANKYAEMRQALIEAFSGEELENRLNALSQAFDLSVKIQAEYRSLQTSMALRVERNRITAHNQIIQQGQRSPFFTGGKIEIDQDEFNRLHEMLTTGVREAVSRFAHLTKQFVLENGFINTEQDRKALEAFLPGLNDLKNVTEILRSDFPNGRDNTMTPIAIRNETIFAGLSMFYASK